MTENEANGTTKWGLPPWVAVVLGILALVFGALALYLFTRGDDHPSNASADVGFVRDMSVHHMQAVEMANIAYRRTDDPDLARWLDVWGLPVSSEQPLMAWMGDHSMELPSPPPGLEDDDSMDHSEMEGSDMEMPLMPGMATTSEVKELETLPVDEMNAQFLRLMIRHHQGGVAMAYAELDLGKDEMVRNFAQQVINTQDNEIATMMTMLTGMTGSSGESSQNGSNAGTPTAGTPVAGTPEAATPVSTHEGH
jgi:uncharacterized protein (DUF305 family)